MALPENVKMRVIGAGYRMVGVLIEFLEPGTEWECNPKRKRRPQPPPKSDRKLFHVNIA